MPVGEGDSSEPNESPLYPPLDCIPIVDGAWLMQCCYVCTCSYMCIYLYYNKGMPRQSWFVHFQVDIITVMYMVDTEPLAQANGV